LPPIAGAHYFRRVRKNKEVVAPQLRSLRKDSARTISISLYPEQHAILAQRSAELNLSMSTVIQLLLELEQRDGLLVREVRQRLSRQIAELDKPSATEKAGAPGEGALPTPLPIVTNKSK
jgi:hypothetical protein